MGQYPEDEFAYNVEQFLALYQKKVKWIWEPWLPAEAMVVFSAWAKTGKSTLTYGLIAAILRGEEFLGYKANRTGVLIMAPSAEENPREIANRIQRMDVGPKHNLWLKIGYFDRTPGAYMQLRQFMKRRDVGLMVIDTLAPFLELEEENDNSEMLAAIRPLVEMAHEDGVSILAIHHHGKRTGRDVSKSIRGASSILGAVDVAWMLSEVRGEAGRRRIETRSRFAETPPQMTYEYDRDTHAFGLIESHEIGELPQTFMAQLQDTLALSPRMLSLYELAEQLDKPMKRVAAAFTGPLPEWCVKAGEGKKGLPFVYGVKGVEYEEES